MKTNPKLNKWRLELILKPSFLNINMMMFRFGFFKIINIPVQGERYKYKGFIVEHNFYLPIFEITHNFKK